MKQSSVLCVIAFLFCFGPRLFGQVADFTEKNPPTAGSHPSGIVAGPDGNLWFAESSASQIGRLTTAGVFAEFRVPSGGGPVGICAGPDGALWFTEPTGNRIGRVTILGDFTEYSLPNAASFPNGIATGSDGALWFTERDGARIGRITTAGVITEFPLPSGSAPYEIAAGPDGALWFTDYPGNRIGRITTAGVLKEFSLPAPFGQPAGIAAATDGALWFTEQGASPGIGRITVDGAIKEFPVSVPFTNPNLIAQGQDGALWFTDPGSHQPGRITTSGKIDEFSLLSQSTSLNGIASGPDGAIWFGELSTGRLGRIALALNRPVVTPGSGATATQTFGVTFYDPAGAADLSVVNVLINNFLNGQAACYLAYDVAGKTLYLVDDAGDAGGPFAGSLFLNGSAGSIKNSQCQINGTGSSATASGTTLVLSLNITFQPGFVGDKIVHLAQRNLAQVTAGWSRVGVWRTPGAPAAQIRALSATPARSVSAGVPQPLSLTIDDSAGTPNLGIVNLLVNDFIDGRHACFLAYSVPTNTLYLVDDAGDAGGPFAGSMPLNGSGSIQNSQCQIQGTGSSATVNGTQLTLTLNVLFSASFSGNRVLYVGARDTLDGNNTDWHALGTVSVQ